MKLNWFSPIPPAPTGIAEYTATVLPWLRPHAEVTVWTDQATWDPAIERHAAVRRYAAGEFSWAELDGGVAVYNMGNNPNFHRGIWEVSQKHAGAVILHDLRLQDLFWSILRPGGDMEPYVAMMESVYGPPGAEAAHAMESGAEDISTVCVRFSLAEAAIRNALGVVVHTEGGFDLAAGKCVPSLAYFPFPYASANESARTAWDKRRKRHPGPPYKVVVTGYINPNRRLKTVVEALAALPGRNRFRLHVYGPLWPEQDVTARIAELGVEKIVTLHGYTPPSMLEDAIADADLAINLRFPTMGEASMSQLQLWDHGLPTIVTRTGWYGTLPETAVRFVEPDREFEDLSRQLTAFAENPAAFSSLGENGRKLLLDQHSPEKYAADLLGFLSRAAEYRATSAIIKTSSRIAGAMQGWIRPLAAEHAADRLASTVMQFLR